MNRDPLLDEIIAILRDDHSCHTVILYGSRARGEETPTSDYDVMGVRASGPVLRDARLFRDAYLDLFIYPEDKCTDPDKEMLHIRHGVVLMEKHDTGRRFLQRLQELYEAGPEKMRDDQLQALQLWSLKALARIKQGGIEGNFRRMELIPALLEQYFTTRGEWYLGPKASLRWLKTHQPNVYKAFDEALQPSSSDAALENVVGAVYPNRLGSTQQGKANAHDAVEG
jgi:predicted nucleotidyltransferase